MSGSSPAFLDRRAFLKTALAAGGGLVLAYYLRPSGLGEVARAEDTVEGSFSPSAFIRVAPDGTVTLYSARPEIGQGIKTSLPMIIAEEMGASWKHVRVVSAPLDDAFGGGRGQGAGGSTSTPNSYLPMRRLGAAARVMLIRAAARIWDVPESECYADNGYIRHRDSGRSLGFGELVAAAAKLPVPDPRDVPLKDPASFTLLGSRVGGVDNPLVVTGKPLFGIDQKLPGLLYGAYEKCPVWSGRPVSANLDEIKALPGVKDAFILRRTVPEGSLTGLVPGVAIVADSTWAAFSARRKLRVVWDEGRYAGSDWDEFRRQARALHARGLASPGGEGLRVERDDGDVDRAFAGAARVLEAEYSYPFISHTNLEPQNATAHVEGGRVRVWAPTQNPGAVQGMAAAVAGVPPEDVEVVVTRSGGGFGRRLDADPVGEAVAMSQRMGAPVKVTWDRTDDLQHDHYRPGGFHFLRGAVDARGRLTAWRMHQVGFGGSVGADGFPARFVPHCRLISSTLDHAIPTGPWRAPGSNTYAFVICGFLDELAHAAGRDPVEFALALLGDRDLVPGSGRRSQAYSAARMRGVVRAAAEKSGWGQPLARGRGRGLGYYFSHQGYIAQVAEVTVSPAGRVKVDRVTAAVDVGSQIVNLSGAENQVQGAINDGLNACWGQELDIRRGRVTQANFNEYPMLRLPDAVARIDIHFLKTDHPPTGLGEPALPPAAPAIANAIFAATGIRLRDFPFSRASLKWA